jgi:peptide/nickel transport system substrate-binding protein
MVPIHSDASPRRREGPINMTNPDGAPHELRNLIDRRSMFKYLAVAGGAAAMGVLSACSADNGQGGTSAASGTSASGGGGGGASSPAGTSTQGSATGAPAHGGSLTVGIGSSLADFDPYNHLAVNFPMMASMDSYRITDDDKYQPSPDLATDWKMADDKQSADITLRETTFHDGSPVTADDVVKGIERALDPKLGISETATASIIKKATATSKTEVHLEFVAPTAESRFLDFMYWFPVIQGSKNSPEDLQKAPAGSGPFMLDSYSPGVSLTMKRNPNYYQSGEPYLDELTIRFFDNNDAVVTALRGKSIAGALAQDARFNTE